MSTASLNHSVEVKTQNNKKVYLVTFYASECLPIQEGDFYIQFHNKEKLKWKRNDR